MWIWYVRIHFGKDSTDHIADAWDQEPKASGEAFII